MAIKVIQSEKEMDLLKNEWNSLLSKSASHVPFLRHEYLTSWWKTRGGGEWDEGELAIVTWRNNNNLLGIAPLFQVKNQLLFLGSFEISDYLDFISPPEILPEFIEKVFSEMDTKLRSVDSLDLFNLPEHSPTIPCLHEIAEKNGWKHSQEILQPAPTVYLPESWEKYLTLLDDHHRREILRKMRKAENYFLPIDWYLVDNSYDLDHEMETFLELMANNPDKDKFLTDKMILQMKTVAKEAYQEGWLQLAFLTVGDLKAAGYINFDYNQKIWIYNSGINPMFENITPGWVLLGKLIQWGIQSHKTELDFMRGNEPYKYAFGGKDKHVIRMKIQRK
jgi:CelD/BcsL family acetyltransferase involved in cellulose biosynthesis